MGLQRKWLMSPARDVQLFQLVDAERKSNHTKFLLHFSGITVLTKLATLMGKPSMITISRAPMSIPSSRAFVAMIPSNCPENASSSMRRRSCAKNYIVCMQCKVDIYFLWITYERYVLSVHRGQTLISCHLLDMLLLWLKYQAVLHCLDPLVWPSWPKRWLIHWFFTALTRQSTYQLTNFPYLQALINAE